MGEFGSNRAAWLIAGFLGRKFMKDILGRWSVLPVLAVAACVWNKWRASQLEGKLEQAKLEEVRRSTRRQMHILRKNSAAGAFPPVSSQQQQQQRRPGDRLGGIPSSSTSTNPKQQQAQRQHMSPTAAAAAAAAAGSNGAAATVAGTGAGVAAAAAAAAPRAAAPKDALASELWAWLGGVGSGRSSSSSSFCSGDRRKRSPSSSSSSSSQRSSVGGGGAGEWRGAFHNRMGNLPRRNAFKTARGKVYLRGGRKGGSWGGGKAPPMGLESVREEDEGSIVAA